MASSALLKSCANVRRCATSPCNFAFGWTVRLRGIGFTIKNFQFDARARTQKSRTCLTLSFCLVRIEVAVSSFKAVSAAALRSHLPKWRNWQTRMVQVHVPARVWGFESLLRHQLIRITGLSVPVTNTATFRIFSVLASTGKNSNANSVSQDIQTPQQCTFGAVLHQKKIRRLGKGFRPTNKKAWASAHAMSAATGLYCCWASTICGKGLPLLSFVSVSSV